MFLFFFQCSYFSHKRVLQKTTQQQAKGSLWLTHLGTVREEKLTSNYLSFTYSTLGSVLTTTFTMRWALYKLNVVLIRGKTMNVKTKC